jgi:hypothetical protein
MMACTVRQVMRRNSATVEDAARAVHQATVSSNA